MAPKPKLDSFAKFVLWRARHRFVNHSNNYTREDIEALSIFLKGEFKPPSARGGSNLDFQHLLDSLQEMLMLAKQKLLEAIDLVDVNIYHLILKLGLDLFDELFQDQEEEMELLYRIQKKRASVDLKHLLDTKFDSKARRALFQWENQKLKPSSEVIDLVSSAEDPAPLMSARVVIRKSGEMEETITVFTSSTPPPVHGSSVEEVKKDQIELEEEEPDTDMDLEPETEESKLDFRSVTQKERKTSVNKRLLRLLSLNNMNTSYRMSDLYHKAAKLMKSYKGQYFPIYDYYQKQKIDRLENSFAVVSATGNRIAKLKYVSDQHKKIQARNQQLSAFLLKDYDTLDEIDIEIISLDLSTHRYFQGTFQISSDPALQNQPFATILTNMSKRFSLFCDDPEDNYRFFFRFAKHQHSLEPLPSKQDSKRTAFLFRFEKDFWERSSVYLEQKKGTVDKMPPNTDFSGSSKFWKSKHAFRYLNSFNNTNRYRKSFLNSFMKQLKHNPELSELVRRSRNYLSDVSLLMFDRQGEKIRGQVLQLLNHLKSFFSIPLTPSVVSEEAKRESKRKYLEYHGTAD